MSTLIQRLAFAWRMATSYPSITTVCRKTDACCCAACITQEMKMSDTSPIYLSDDATEAELAEMAEEKRHLDELLIRP